MVTSGDICPYDVSVWREGKRMKFDWTRGYLLKDCDPIKKVILFAGHEACESVWLESQQPEKMFLLFSAFRD